MSEPVTVQATIRDTAFGSGVRLVAPVNLYGCTIQSGCFIGPFVEIQTGAVVGKNTRIQSHSFICEGVSIGADCFIGHSVVFVNDTFSTGQPARGNRDLYRKTVIGSRVSIGSNATILPVTICDDAVIGAGAVVTRNLDFPGKYAGNPARLLERF